MSLANILAMSPTAFILLIVGIVVVAIAVILYVLVFHKKVKASSEKRSEKKAKKADEYSKSTSMASSVFEGRESESLAAKEAEATKKADVDKIMSQHGHKQAPEKKPVNPFESPLKQMEGDKK